MTRIRPLILLAACAVQPPATVEQPIGGFCPSPPLRCQARDVQADEFCTEACNGQRPGGVAYCPEITDAEAGGCELQCRGLPNDPPAYTYSGCVNYCFSLIYHTCVGGVIAAAPTTKVE